MEEPRPKVLYVDDEEPNLLVFQTQFKKHFDVRTAPSGDRGLEILSSEEIPVVISDQRMPEMSGWAFLGRVRRRWPDTVRMIITAYTNFDDVVQAINEGEIARYLIKPWDPADLHGAIVNSCHYYYRTKEQRLLREQLFHRERLSGIGAVTTLLVEELSRLESSFRAEDPRQQLDEIEAAVGRFTILIDTIRMYSRSSVGLRIEPQPVDLHQLVDRCRPLLEMFPEVRGLATFEVVRAEGALFANTDRALVEHALISLVRSVAAADQSSDSKVRIGVGPAKERAVIEIRAKGPPLPEGDLARLDQSLLVEVSDPRLGLGFQLAQRAVLAYGGAFDAANRPDGGVSFRLSLPGTPEGLS